MCTPQRNEAAAAECVATIHVGRERPSPAVPPDAAQAPADSGIIQKISRLSFATALANAVTLDAHGQYHLYFHAADELVPGFKRCGEVDAAQHMPQSLFAPANFPALEAYAEATVRLYRVPVLRNSVSLGRCASIGLTEPGGVVQGIDWTPAALMGPVCAEKCECSFDGVHEAGNLPLCKDRPDDPEAGSWCSLCGPNTACTDCVGNTVNVQLFYPSAEGGGTPPPPLLPPPPPPLSPPVSPATLPRRPTTDYYNAWADGLHISSVSVRGGNSSSRLLQKVQHEGRQETVMVEVPLGTVLFV
eukprot:COSAG02_NODE_19012_length_905_cov_1.420596_1_plen_301_part_11